MAKVSATNEWDNNSGTTRNWSAKSTQNKHLESAKTSETAQNGKPSPSELELKDNITRGSGTGGTSGWNQWNSGSTGEKKAKGTGNGGGWSQWPTDGKESNKDKKKTPSNEEVLDQETVRLQQSIILVCQLNRYLNLLNFLKDI